MLVMPATERASPFYAKEKYPAFSGRVQFLAFFAKSELKQPSRFRRP